MIDRASFGNSVALSGGTVLIGAPAINQSLSGRAYVYQTAVPPPVYTLSLTMNGDQFRFRFSSIIGRTYRLERNPLLQRDGWAAATDPIPGTGSPVEVTQPASPDGMAFYRLVVTP